VSGVLRALALAALAVTGLAACVPARGGWDERALAARHAELDAHAGNRLADALPHLQPDRDGAALFLCRWSTAAPIPVSLPADASDLERELLRLALRAWSEAGLGIRFVEVKRSPGLEIRFANPERDGWAPRGAGDTVADCAISADFEAEARIDRVPADMSFASVYLQRSERDALGRVRALERDELLGAALHEVGHALGFAGHVVSGRSVMTAAPEISRSHGRRVLEGQAFADATLAALYALPSGVVVGRVEIAAEQRSVLSRLRGIALEARWQGPWSRVGDQSARLLWRERGGASAALELADWPARVRTGEVGVLEPNARAQSALHAVAAGGPR